MGERRKNEREGKKLKFGLWLCFIFSNKSPVPEPAVNVRSGVFEQHIADRERVLEREMEREKVRMREC